MEWVLTAEDCMLFVDTKHFRIFPSSQKVHLYTGETIYYEVTFFPSKWPKDQDTIIKRINEGLSIFMPVKRISMKRASI